MHRCLHVFVLLALLVSSTVLTATAQEATPGATPAGGDSLLAGLGYPEIRVTTDGTTHDFPTELEAGRYHRCSKTRATWTWIWSSHSCPRG